MTQLAQAAGAAATRPLTEDSFAGSGVGGASLSEVGQSRGTAGIRTLHRQISARPKNVVRAFNDAIQREHASDVMGLSLQTYVERRLCFAQDREAEERFVAILRRL